ncbi:DUF5957 family protein [Gracilibacillus sp. HCP3S3_G5_1]|uniref:DUF5957 family protein n=1 Tax=unclassified Gracilibacillus TaxID=2625209 RepID=UPI003F8A8399
MRVFIAIIVGLIGGFVLGIALSSLIGILGMTIFNTPIGIKFLPYYTAIICAILVPFLDRKQKNG